MPEEEKQEKEEAVEVEPEPIKEGEALVFSTTLAMNGQATIRKEIRERLKLEPGVMLWLKVLKVITPDGKTTYESLECQ
jgi:hypothetical protein